MDGDSRYLPPEILLSQPPANPKMDALSHGVTMLEIIIQKDLPSNGGLWSWIRSGEVSFQGLKEKINNFGEFYSKTLEEVIQKLLHPILQHRMSISELLEHPF